jgi:hypothetical protein
VNITDELTVGRLSVLILRLWFDRDESGQRQVPVLLILAICVQYKWVQVQPQSTSVLASSNLCLAVQMSGKCK